MKDDKESLAALVAARLREESETLAALVAAYMARPIRKNVRD